MRANVQRAVSKDSDIMYCIVKVCMHTWTYISFHAHMAHRPFVVSSSSCCTYMFIPASKQAQPQQRSTAHQQYRTNKTSTVSSARGGVQLHARHVLPYPCFSYSADWRHIFSPRSALRIPLYIVWTPSRHCTAAAVKTGANFELLSPSACTRCAFRRTNQYV